MTGSETSERELHADVLIIGAGASGGIAALRLADAGLRVIALEQGHWHDPENYRGDKLDWELAAGKQWSSNPNVRDAWEDYPVDLADSEVSISNFNGVGGATILFNAIWLRLLPSNFRTRTLDGVADDWPISYEELLPYYERTDREVGVSGLGGNPAYPPAAEPPLPPMPLGTAGLRIARTIAHRGWHWWPDTNAILSAPYDGRRPCVQRGTCAQGCNEGAKSSIDLTHWQRVTQGGGRVITGARVSRIVLDEQGLAAGAEWHDANGRGHFQSADVVLLAANGVGSPRLLLMSDDPRYPDGIANRSGLVGKCLMVHPLAVVSGLFEEELDTWQGHNGSSLHCLEFIETDRRRGFVRGAKWSLRPIGGPMMDGMATLTSGGGTDFHRRVAERFGHGVRWSITCEDLPDETNRVVLSTTQVDSSGLPAPKVVYYCDENSRRNLAFNVAHAMDVLRDAGAWQVEAVNPAGTSAHLMGTARMGDDPTTSVVDRWGMSHDIPNLGIIDSSIFVTAGAVNPASTICALALRTADHLLEVRSQLRVPTQRVLHATPARRTRPTRRKSPRSVNPALGPEERDRLARLADHLIPAGEGMPAASEVGVHDRLLDQVLAARPDLAEPLTAVLSHALSDPALRTAELQSNNRPGYQALLTVVVGGYYLDADVRRRIGYPGQEARPVRIEGYPVYMEEGLLDHLVDGTWVDRRGRVPGAGPVLP